VVADYERKGKGKEREMSIELSVGASYLYVSVSWLVVLMVATMVVLLAMVKS